MAKWETPISIDNETICITVSPPKNMFSVVMAALNALGEDWNWAQYDDAAVSVNEIADRMKQMNLDTVISDCEVAQVREIGELLMWPDAAHVPAKWLKCQGQAVSRTTYAALFAVIGTRWGAGDGSTTFNLPTFVSKSPMGGVDATIGGFAGEMSHTLTVNEMPDHGHELNDSLGNAIRVENGASNQNFGIRRVAGAFNLSNVVLLQTVHAGGGQAHNTLHPVAFVHFLIYTGVS